MEERTLESKQIYEGRRVSLRVDKVVLPGGRETTREVASYPDCVAIVAVDNKGNVILVRQYRHAVGRELLELPAGGIEPGEAPEESARRELEEETGYKAGKMERIGGAYTAPGYSTEFMHLFLATDLEPGPSRAEDDEIIQVVPLSLSRVQDLLSSGEICDGKSVIGLLALISLMEKNKQ
jgi:ADP-ribose pyrophosphatase